PAADASSEGGFRARTQLCATLGEPQRVPERDDRRAEPDAKSLRPRGDVGRHDDRVRQQFAAPDAEMVLGEPNAVETRLIEEPGEIANLVHDLKVVTPVPGIGGIAEIANLHRHRSFSAGNAIMYQDGPHVTGQS